MDWFAPVDLYCERASAAFWAEPLNALTNLAVLLPVAWAVAVARARGERDPLVWALIVLAGLMGAGSFVFHTMAERWAEIVDMAPIWSFMVLYFYAAWARMLAGGRGHKRVFATLLVLGAVGAVMAQSEAIAVAEAAAGGAPAMLWNGTGQYLPAALALAALAFRLWWRRHPLWPWVLAAVASFGVALVSRALDQELCAAFPTGTHFLWHIGNGFMLAFLLQMLIRSPAGGHRGEATRIARR